MKAEQPAEIPHLHCAAPHLNAVIELTEAADPANRYCTSSMQCRPHCVWLGSSPFFASTKTVGLSFWRAAPPSKGLPN